MVGIRNGMRYQEGHLSGLNCACEHGMWGWGREFQCI